MQNERVSDERLAVMREAAIGYSGDGPSVTISSDPDEAVSILTELQQRRASVVTPEMVVRIVDALNMALPHTLEFDAESGGYYDTDLSREISALTAALSVSHETGDGKTEAAFDMLAHLARQREWSGRTFGPGTRMAGVIDHIRKELREIEADPSDITEWIDVVILALDGAWRAGYQPQQIIDAMVAKQTKNEARNWPDWRTMPADKAIEHDLSGEALAPTDETQGVKRDKWEERFWKMDANFDRAIARAETAEASLAAMRDALEFYAEVGKYPAPLTGGMGDLWSDCGQIARTALAAGENGR